MLLAGRYKGNRLDEFAAIQGSIFFNFRTTAREMGGGTEGQEEGEWEGIEGREDAFRCRTLDS